MSNTYKNPVCDGADPFVLLHDGVYYLYSTNAPDGFRVFTSTDMGTWTDRGYCLRAEDVQGDRWFWAPEVLFRDGDVQWNLQSSGCILLMLLLKCHIKTTF